MGKSILSFNNEEAQRYFLMSENYSTLELPRYFDFDAIIKQATSMCRGKTLQQLVKNSNLKDYGPWNFENVNYHMFNNKRAKYSWRKIELIHPILYVDLVNIITQKENWDFIKARFNEFASNKKIICCSLPISNNNKRETILNWWNSFEQRSIACGLDYMYLGKTDIESCYPSIYTHSIAWALNTKESAKLERELWAAKEKVSEEKVRAAGCTITELEPGEKEKFQAAMAPLYAQFGAGYEDVIKNIQAQ